MTKCNSARPRRERRRINAQVDRLLAMDEHNHNQRVAAAAKGRKKREKK